MSKQFVLCLGAASVCFLGLAAAQSQAQGPLVIRDVRLFDGERTMEHRSVLLDSGRIIRVGNADMPAPRAVEIDGRNRTLLPGFIDSHVHIADSAASALHQALVFGVTTVLDMFSGGARFERIKQIRLADMPALADAKSAGVGATVPGGHPTQMGGPPIPTLSSAADAPAFVEARIAEGSDYIKIIRSDPSSGKPMPTLDSATIAAIVREAHARRKLVVAHIGSERDARMVLGAGVDGLAHMFIADTVSSDFGAFVATHHGFVIPTLVTFAWACGRLEAPSLAADTSISPYLATRWRTSLTMTAAWPPRTAACAGTDAGIRQLVASQVPILAGTDAPIPGTTYGASLHAELALLVRVGLTPEAALRAATLEPARAFRLDDRGAIRPGLRADVILVDGDPTRDILATRRIVGVWKRGIRVERPRVDAR
jgi:imidazolonepropionase-like amidohydrolase